MSNEVFAALLALVGSMMGSLGGILASARLTNFRLQQLEKKVAEHNKIVERTYKLEGRMLEAEHDIRDMKGSFVYEPESKN